MWNVTIKAAPPYDFDRVLERLSLDPLNKVDVHKRTVLVPLYSEKEEPFVAAVKAIGSKENPVFEISGEQDEQKERAIHELTRIFQWKNSLKTVQDHFLQTNLAPLFQEHEGTPLVLDFHPYACLMKCIIHQQLNLSFAYQLTTAFVQTFGFKVDNVWFYPKPETVAKLNYENLRALKFSMRKAEYVIDTSRLIAEGALPLQAFHEWSDDDIMKKLVQVRGIGPWTVQNFLLFGLGRPNLFPAADIGLQNAVKHYFQLEKKPTKEEMENYSREWAPYLSYAAFYLWRSIEKRRGEAK
ncbi:DNA-3-methyladenine glycosylase II [Aeribacillus composti]|uniref:DNA-3-methyladenine glycosylase family protein n=1 Tax=Aeribacillus TaxID=1055323 RepID=UPI001199A3F9|nr:DNA-3-methyladenine glycosylase [Aeribacillus composti]TVZ76008.1 DNA-3-methyladenine glycosylase II [Aeribacillus composti]